MEDDYIKLPRLYVDQELNGNVPAALTDGQAHYLRAVLRRGPGDGIRLFNGRDGEWRAAIVALDKKGGTALPQEQTRPQPRLPRPVHLAFAPIKKQRLEWLIEKAVELGATHFHPVITDRADAFHINEDRIRRQIVEAAEQCERLDIPVFDEPQTLTGFLAGRDMSLPLLACLERAGAPPIAATAPSQGAVCVLIGPEGGFAPHEQETLGSSANIFPVSLGPYILRSETAVCAALAALLP